MAIYKLCTTCRKKVSAVTGCRKCQAKALQKRRRQYDTEQRKQQLTSIYKTKEWRVIRNQVLRRFNYLDMYELKINKRFVKADMVHHIIELSENEALAYNADNLIPLSNKTHSYIHSEYNKSENKKVNMQKELMKIINSQ